MPLSGLTSATIGNINTWRDFMAKQSEALELHRFTDIGGFSTSSGSFQLGEPSFPTTGRLAGKLTFVGDGNFDVENEALFSAVRSEEGVEGNYLLLNTPDGNLVLDAGADWADYSDDQILIPVGNGQYRVAGPEDAELVNKIFGLYFVDEAVEDNVSATLLETNGITDIHNQTDANLTIIDLNPGASRGNAGATAARRLNEQAQQAIEQH